MRKSLWIAGLGLFLAACTNPGSQAPGTTLEGVVQRSGGLVTMGGKVLDLSQARVSEDGQAVAASSVRDGSEISAQGVERGGRLELRAVELRYRVKGPADEVNAAEGFVTVVGLKALVTPETRIVEEKADGSETPLTLDDLSAGDYLKVAGLAQADDSVVATRIEREGPENPGKVELRVALRELDAAAKTFTYGLRTYTVDYSGAQLKGALSEGAYVRVKGQKSGTTVVASQVRVEEERGGGKGRTRIELEGIVAGLDTAAKTFSVEGLTVEYSQAELRGELREGARVHVRGTLEGDTVKAQQVKVQGKGERGGGGAELEGPIAGFDAASRTFTVNGVTVSVDARTRYADDRGEGGEESRGDEDEDRMSPEEFWGTGRDGQTVEVEGEATGEGALLAHEIELK